MLAGVADCRRSQKWGCKGRWALGFKPRRGSEVKERRRTTRFWGRKEETMRLQSKWGGDHAALKEGGDHVALKERVDS